VTLGFSACAMAVSSLLIGDFNRFLPALDEFGNIAEEEKGPDLGDEQIQHLL
jgi:hypothetical protein